MRRCVMVVGLVVAMGLLAAAQCPPIGLPVTRVDPTTTGGYLIWIQNTAKCAYNEFLIVFQVPVTGLRAVAVNGTAVEEITGSGPVWRVKLVGAGVAARGFLILSVTGVAPAVPATCPALVRAVFPAPLCR